MNDALSSARRDNATVHGRFAAVARTHPERIALASDASSLTYAELDARSDRVAAALAAAGVEPGSYVALLMERSVESIVVVIGVLKAGAAYLPIDTRWPVERVAFALRDADVAAIVADEGLDILAEDIPLFTVASLEAPASYTTVADGDGSGDDPAYAMYTSGSTGTPKGVEIRHASILRLVLRSDYIDFDAPGCCTRHRWVSMRRPSRFSRRCSMAAPASSTASVCPPAAASPAPWSAMVPRSPG